MQGRHLADLLLKLILLLLINRGGVAKFETSNSGE